LTPGRRAVAEAAEEVSAAQAALEIAQSNRAKADADLAGATSAVDAAINALFARDLLKRIDEAKKLHDTFMAQALVLDEVAPDHGGLQRKPPGSFGCRGWRRKIYCTTMRKPFTVERMPGRRLGRRFVTTATPLCPIEACRMAGRTGRSRPPTKPGIA